MAHALPELVILDLVLPKMSGLELLAEWRGSPRTSDLPVFVLTSKDLTKEEEKYVRAHALTVRRPSASLLFHHRGSDTKNLLLNRLANFL
jgi:CheY-like chemotaxis protein